MRRPSATLLMLLAGAGCAFSQQKVNFGGDGSEPRDPLKYEHGSGDRYVMVTVPGTPLLTDARDSATQIRKTVFREVFLAFREDTSGQFFLVRNEGEPPVWGWIRKNALLSDLTSRRSEDKSNTFVKVALRNNLQVSLSETVPLYGGPGAGYGVVENDGLAEIFYVYDSKKGSDGVEYVLLGWDAEWNPSRAAADSVIRGWVRLDHCIVWDHRIAVYYNRRNIKTRKPVNIYRSVEDLKAGDPKNAIAVEAKDSDKSLTYDKARFPVLQNGPMMKIAYIGDPTRNLKVSIDQLNRAQEVVRNMQVLFVIDGTVSMGKYFKEVQRAVRDYVASIPSEQERARHHFAVAVYRDYEDGPNGEMEIISDFDDPRGLQKLGDLKEYSSPDDKTLPEAVFNGIVRSVKKVKWEKGNLKVVVVIGDHPNHPVDPRGYTVQSVVKELQTFSAADGLQSGFRFHALNVHYDPRLKNLNDEFMNEMRQIGNQFKPVGRIQQITNDGGDMDIFRRSVADALRNVLDTSGQVNGAVTKMQQGQTVNEIAPVYGTEMTNLAINLLRELGIKPDVISLKGISQISQEGWVQMTVNRDQAMEPWVYIERTEMDEFRGFLASLLRSSDQKQRASQIVKDAVMRTTGDPLVSGETVADYVKRAFAIPFRDDSTILSKTPEQLQQSLEEQSYWIQFRKRVGYSYEVLGLVSEERDPSALRWDEGQNKWLRSNPHPAELRSWVTTRGGQKYCWIPLEYMP